LIGGPDAVSGIQVTREEGEVAGLPKEVSQEKKAERLRAVHSTPLGAYIGVNRTYQKLKLYIDWPGMKKSISRSTNPARKIRLLKQIPNYPYS
jgi:hypothetical protein